MAAYRSAPGPSGWPRVQRDAGASGCVVLQYHVARTVAPCRGAGVAGVRVRDGVGDGSTGILDGLGLTTTGLNASDGIGEGRDGSALLD